MKVRGILVFRRALFAFGVLLALVGTAQAQSQKADAEIPPNSTIVFGGSVSNFASLVLNDNSIITFGPSLLNVTITVDHLVVHGKATIDLTRHEAAPDAPVKPGAPAQASNDNAPQNGAAGSPGLSGSKGVNGINLVLRVGNKDVSDGALWINTDGGPGGAGGPGGDGAKGSSGPSTCTRNADGGNGGPGGTGGTGGAGGDTGAIWVSIGGQPPLTSHPTNGVSPTSRPSDADLNGAIVIAGNPGDGGPGGNGGNGGPAGEGHGKSGGIFCTDTGSHSGGNGSQGANGHKGAPGSFTRAAPVALHG